MNLPRNDAALRLLELIVMFCCGEQRNGKFCQECGAELIADTVKRNLADYLDRQARIVSKNIENRIKHDTDGRLKDSTIQKWREKAKKWEEWRDWVLSAKAEQET